MLKKLSQPWRKGWEQWKQIANKTPNHEGQHLKVQRVSNHHLEETKPWALHQVVEALSASTYDPDSPEFSPTAMQHFKQPYNYVCENSMGRSTIGEHEAEKIWLWNMILKGEIVFLPAPHTTALLLPLFPQGWQRKFRPYRPYRPYRPETT